MSQPPVDPNHYSYAVYADPAMAASFDAARFGGPIGQLLADSQERVLLDFAGALGGRTVLDVGTGTGRGALILAKAGGVVTGVDASREMLAVGEARAQAAGLHVRFDVGDAHDLAFGDQSFDTCVSLRVLMHTPDWRRCVAELCRVSARHVIVDYPALFSAASLQAGGRRLLHTFGAKTEPYRTFAARAVAAAFAAHGFRIVREHRQFVLPIAFHKLVGSRAVTERVEGALEAVGLLGLAGSPVTILAERCASS